MVTNPPTCTHRPITPVDHAREERARLQAEIGQLKKKLAEAEAVNDETDQDRSLLTTMVFTLKKQLAQYEQGGGEAAAVGGMKMEG